MLSGGIVFLHTSGTFYKIISTGFKLLLQCTSRGCYLPTSTMPWLCAPTWAMYWYFIHTIAIGGLHTHKPIVSEGKRVVQSQIWRQSCSTSKQYVKMDGFFSLIPVLFWKTITLIHHVWMDHVWSVCNLVSSFWLFSNSHDLLKQSMMLEHGLRMEPCENSECL